MTFEIEDGVELPKTVRTSKYPFEALKVGQSFLVPEASKVKTIRTLASTRGKRLSTDGSTVSFKVAQVENGVRVWRVA